jgi:hypothetical protein
LLEKGDSVKLQFATIEAIIVLIFILPVASFVMYSLNSYNQRAFAARSSLLDNAAVSGVLNLIWQNATAMSCLLYSRSCASNMLANIIRIYSIDGLSVSSQNLSLSSGIVSGNMVHECAWIGGIYMEICISAD